MTHINIQPNPSIDSKEKDYTTWILLSILFSAVLLMLNLLVFKTDPRLTGFLGSMDDGVFVARIAAGFIFFIELLIVHWGTGKIKDEDGIGTIIFTISNLFKIVLFLCLLFHW